MRYTYLVILNFLYTFAENFKNRVNEEIAITYYFFSFSCSRLMNDFNTELLKLHNASWIKVNKLPPLIFDHNKMVIDAMAALKRKSAICPVGFNLLPEKFTLPQLQCLYEAIYQTRLDKRNFRKKLISMDILEKLDEKDKEGSRRGAFYYMFNQEKYSHLLDSGLYFSL